MLDFMLYLGMWQQLVAVLIIFCPVSVLGLYVVRRWVPIETLKKNHEVAGFTFGVVGAFYGLFLAFVIVAAWERYDRADESVRHEAIGLTELYRLGADFEEPTRSILAHSVRGYVRSIVEQDWPEMADNTYGTKRDAVGAMGLWKIVSDYKPADPRQQLLVEKSFDALSQISDARAMRYMYYSENLPEMVWMVIYVGFFITVGFGYFFGLETIKSQALMCAVFSGLLGLTILAILELAHPYQGTHTVSAFPLVYAQKRMDAIDEVAAGRLADSDLGLSSRVQVPSPAPIVSTSGCVATASRKAHAAHFLNDNHRLIRGGADSPDGIHGRFDTRRSRPLKPGTEETAWARRPGPDGKSRAD